MSTRSAARPLTLPSATEQPDEPAATSASAVRNIPLDRLVLSPNNVRKTPASADEEAELKASIRAAGLKQNLVVHRVPDADDMYAVTAGGRRFKALKELAAEGFLPADLNVPCLIEKPEAALETSLMENSARSPMPAHNARHRPPRRRRALRDHPRDNRVLTPASTALAADARPGSRHPWVITVSLPSFSSSARIAASRRSKILTIVSPISAAVRTVRFISPRLL
jgi:hypothetical protein